MRFQGENCTLSFGLSLDKGLVRLSGTVWPLRQATRSQPQQPVVRFHSLLPPDQLTALQTWLASESSTPLPFTDPIRYVRRLSSPVGNITQLELELSLEQVPVWWNWEIRFPLIVRLDIRQPEFVYLTRALQRDSWSVDLSW
ncbi:hypothetical protein GGR92_000380 [Spirosoma lacussanchae]|uniref:hypothetical protein n=1 Tax=Spirosoma lacussanchae TaxID=1884249 RepID=UPI001107C172|nr:hypothetical protein [Spirosoma lacussanchae]